MDDKEYSDDKKVVINNEQSENSFIYDGNSQESCTSDNDEFNFEYNNSQRMSITSEQENQSDVCSYSLDETDKDSQSLLNTQTIEKEFEYNLKENRNYELNENAENSREDICKVKKNKWY